MRHVLAALAAFMLLASSATAGQKAAPRPARVDYVTLMAPIIAFARANGRKVYFTDANIALVLEGEGAREVLKTIASAKITTKVGRGNRVVGPCAEIFTWYSAKKRLAVASDCRENKLSRASLARINREVMSTAPYLFSFLSISIVARSLPHEPVHPPHQTI